MERSAIDTWLDELRERWLDHDIAGIVDLFEPNVEYWETPFERIDPEELSEAWEETRTQGSIELSFETFASQGDRHAVRWRLAFSGTEGGRERYSGTYLIGLGEHGRCRYFLQTCESD